MKTIIITIGTLMTMSCDQSYNRDINEAINNIQDMQEWMIEDRNNGTIEAEYADYYILWLEDSEQLLINQITN